MLGIVTGMATHRHPLSFRMRKVPMAALAASVHKPGFFQVGYQLANLSRHFSIKLVSQLFKAVKQLNFARHGAIKLYQYLGLLPLWRLSQLIFNASDGALYFLLLQFGVNVLNVFDCHEVVATSPILRRFERLNKNCLQCCNERGKCWSDFVFVELSGFRNAIKSEP
jgi:hypothetical protein